MRKTSTSLLAGFLLLLAACSGRPTVLSTPTSTQANSLQATAQLPSTGNQASNTEAAGTPVATSAPAVNSPASGAPASTPTIDQTQPAQASPAAIDCTSPAEVTPSLTEGPYFKPNSPERTSLLDSGVTGTKLTITGYVLTPDCKPVPGALLDFWQANSQGQYDNSGYTLRGHQFTDENGRYQLQTIVPGLYPGRTEHIHVKVQAPNGPVLTTQLFFPGESTNQSDSIFDPKLVLPIQSASDRETASFNFVVNP